VGKDKRMSLQCAPCLSDLALVREAVTSIGGTATCTAHAVLMRYPSDDPGRRRRRLADLRTLAEQRVVDATGTEKEKLELLVQEYAVAEAMDLGASDRVGPGRGSERSRRGRDRDRRPGEPREPREHREPREGREGRPPREPREPRPDRESRPDREQAPAGTDAAAPTPGPDVTAVEGGAPATADAPSAAPTAAPDPAPAPAPEPTGDSATPAAPAPQAPTPPAPAPEAPAVPVPATPERAAASPAPAADPPASGGESSAPHSTDPASITLPTPAKDDSAFGSPEVS
jgi:hypothetical protein